MKAHDAKKKSIICGWFGWRVCVWSGTIRCNYKKQQKQIIQNKTKIQKLNMYIYFDAIFIHSHKLIYI